MKWDLKKIWNIKLNDEKSLRKRAVQFLCGFLVLMILFTLLSRAADSLTVAKVKVAAAEKKVIEYKLEASGKVEQNREQAVITEPNLTIDGIYVNEGQMVEPNDLLLQINMADLEEQILIAKQAIEKLMLGEKDNKSQDLADQHKKSKAKERASQDYDTATDKGNRLINEAANSLSIAQAKLDAFRKGVLGNVQGDDPVRTALEDTCKEKERLVQEAGEEKEKLEEEIKKQIQKAIEEAKKQNGNGTITPEEEHALEQQIRNKMQEQTDANQTKEETAKHEAEQAAQALQAYEKQKEEQSGSEFEASEEQLEQAVAAAEKAYHEAVEAKQEGQQNASRALEDADAPEAGKSTAEIAEMEIQQKEMELEKLEALHTAQGRVISPVKGIITKLDVATGGKTTEMAAVTLADLGSGCKFVAQIQENQQKHIARGDTVSLKPSNNGTLIDNLTVSTIKPNKENKEMLDVTVLLDADVMEMGTSATLAVVKKSSPYNTCIPIGAIHEDNNKYYILILNEEETILGKEMTAQRVDVTVQEKNDTYAAIQDGTITSEQKVITQSDKSIEAGSRVRLLET